jgi:hypothetical protein
VLGRRRRTDLPPLAEEDVYARSYGERSEEVSNVQRRAPRQQADAEPRLTDRALRDAFRARLEKRDD